MWKKGCACTVSQKPQTLASDSKSMSCYDTTCLLENCCVLENDDVQDIVG